MGIGIYWNWINNIVGLIYLDIYLDKKYLLKEDIILSGLYKGHITETLPPLFQLNSYYVATYLLIKIFLTHNWPIVQIPASRLKVNDICSYLIACTNLWYIVQICFLYIHLDLILLITIMILSIIFYCANFPFLIHKKIYYANENFQINITTSL